MKTYYSYYNNGVNAIVGEEVYADYQKQNKIHELFVEWEANKPYSERTLAKIADAATEHLCMPIFTFTRQDRFKTSPWFTGNNELMDALVVHLKACGHVLRDSGFYIPFSNGCEAGLHGPDAMKRELAYVTTSRQFKDVFGVSTGFLVAKYGLPTEV